MEEVKELRKQREQPQGAKTIDEYGNRKKKTAIDLGLTPWVLPPITKRGEATYRTLSQTRIDPSSTNKELADPKTIILPGTYKFYDKYEADPSKRWKIIKNILGAGDIVIDKVTGKQVIEDIIDPITMHSGFLRVNIEMHYRQYVFMELHPLNQSNKFRPNDIAAKFVRTDLSTNKSLAYKAAEQDLGYDAEGAVMKMSKDDIIGYATSCNVPTMDNRGPRAISEIKIDLRNFARKDPRKFFAMANNYEAAVRMNVLDALGFGLIEYESDRKRFIIPETGDDPIFTHLADEDPNESLIKHFLTDKGADKYQAVVNMIEYWN